MEDYLQQGIQAAKDGDKPRAFDLLTRASEVPATSEKAWLWLSSVVNDDSERLFCLNNVLRINSDNTTAQRGTEVLRQKGIFPAVPVYPEPRRGQDFTPGQVSSPNPNSKPSQAYFPSSTRNQTAPAPVAVVASPPKPGYETNWQKQELSGLFQYAAMELAANKSHQVVEKLLVGRGASLETAKTLVKDAQYAVKKLRREKHKKRMTGGLSMIIIGLVLTCGSYAISDSFNGKFFLFYGAIFVGLINLIVGLIGWLVNG
jgi:hypothetical protein